MDINTNQLLYLIGGIIVAIIIIIALRDQIPGIMESVTTFFKTQINGAIEHFGQH